MDIGSFKTPGLEAYSLRRRIFTMAHKQRCGTWWTITTGSRVHNPWLDEDIQPLALHESEIDDVVAFLAALTSAQYRDKVSRNSRSSGRCHARIGRDGISRGLSARSRFGLSYPEIAFHDGSWHQELLGCARDEVRRAQTIALGNTAVVRAAAAYCCRAASAECVWSVLAIKNGPLIE